MNDTVAAKPEDEGGEEAGEVWVGAVLERCRIVVDRGERGYLGMPRACRVTKHES